MWSHQIRSYILQPYTLVKDLRTGVETNDARSVLDGDLDRFLKEAAILNLDNKRSMAYGRLVAATAD